MSLELCLYLIDLLGNIQGCFLVISTLAAAAAVLIGIVRIDTYDEEEKAESLGWIKKAAIISLASLSFCILIPSSKTMYMIVGTSYLKQSDIPQKVKQLLDKKLDELIGKEITNG